MAKIKLKYQKLENKTKVENMKPQSLSWQGYFCCVCGTNFSNEEILKSHQLALHRVPSSEEVNDDYICVDCNFVFIRPSILLDHRSKVHHETPNQSLVDSCTVSHTASDKIVAPNRRKVDLQTKQSSAIVKSEIKNEPSSDTDVQETYIVIQKPSKTSGSKSGASQAAGSVDEDQPRGNASHKNEIENRKPNAKQFICPECGRGFSHNTNLRRHIRSVHKLSQQQSKQYKCYESDCDESFFTQLELINHLSNVHSMLMEHETHTFRSEEEFQAWKITTEKQTTTFYKKYKAKTKSDGSSTTKYICNRQGKYVDRVGENRKRRIKKSGSCKTGKACPSYMEAVIEMGNVSVTYHKTHYGHEIEPKLVRFHKEDRQEIAKMLLGNTPAKEIIAKIQEGSGDSGKLSRLNTLDIRNVVRDFKLQNNDKSEQSESVVEESNEKLKSKTVELWKCCTDAIEKSQNKEFILDLKNKAVKAFDAYMASFPVKRKHSETNKPSCKKKKPSTPKSVQKADEKVPVESFENEFVYYLNPMAVAEVIEY